MTILSPGRTIDFFGYVRVKSKRRRQDWEHRVIAERVLGKPLPKNAVVHHHNGDKTDNRNCNLVICESPGYHSMIHGRMKVVSRGGDPETHKICGDCDGLLITSEFNSSRNRYDGLQRHCKRCQSLYSARLRDRNRGDIHPPLQRYLNTIPHIAAIRADQRPQHLIAAEYGICQTTVSRIKRHCSYGIAASNSKQLRSIGNKSEEESE